MPAEERKSAKVISSAFGMTATNKEQLCITFECADGERLSYYQLFETDQNLEFVEKVLKTLGWDPMAHGWSVELLHQSDVLVGREASLVIEQDEWNGKPRRRVKYVNDPRGGGGLKETLTPDAARSFGARLRARLSGTPTAVAAPAPAPIVYSDADVPF